MDNKNSKSVYSDLTVFFISLLSDQAKKSCKIRDEYFMVKDLVLPKEALPSNRNPVTGAYPSNQGKAIYITPR